MQILFLSPRQCWPPRGGAKLRDYHLARALGRHADLTYLHFSDPGSAPLSRNDLPFCREVISIAKPRPYTVGKVVRGFLGSRPLPVVNYTSPEMSAAAQEAARKNRYDIVHLDSLHMTGYVDAVARVLGGAARIVYNWHNIESELMRRYAENAPAGVRKFYAQYTARRMAALEKKLLDEAFGHIVCSDRERRELRQVSPQARIEVVENGVDTGAFSPAGDEDRRWLVFVGLMDYHANVEAILSFAQSTWPVVAERYPRLGLRIVGANPVPAVRALAAHPRIEVTGTVPEVRPYYDSALAAIVPLRTGGGTRLKILEAMAAGVPVISTKLGAEGLEAEAGRHILIADDPDAWQRHISTVAERPQETARVTAAALELVRSRYDWNILGDRLAALYQEWLRERK